MFFLFVSLGDEDGEDGEEEERTGGGVNIVFLYSLSMLRGEEGWMEGRRKEKEREIEEEG